MKYLVSIEGPEGSSIVPEEFFSRIKTDWLWVKDRQHLPSTESSQEVLESDHTGMCVVEQESLNQLSAMVAKAPGAGILRVKVYPLSNN